MNLSKVFFLFLLVAFSGCTPISTTSTSPSGNAKILRMEDMVYEKEIRTVRLFRRGSPLSPAVIQLGIWDLVLEFDDIAEDRDTYNASVLHCNYDWTASGLQDLDFMRDFNEFPLNNAELSADTQIPYVHYSFPVPPVKLPGNYVLMVYRGSDKQDLILTRRFMVYDNRVTFSKDGSLIGPGTIADVNQQLNFTVNHSNIDILNPLTDVHVNIRQNQRWDVYVENIKPSFVRDIEKELEYRFFDENRMFKGGNEFRFFDIRSLRNPGRNVSHVDRSKKPYNVFLARDKSRRDEAYAQYDEINGNFLIENYDFGDLSYTDYAWIHFTLATRPVAGEVYVAGAFNNWRFDNTNLMRYDSTQNAYTSRILLKQGWYDYQYVVRSKDLPPYYFEGTYFQTENFYEVFVYYRPFQPRADLLIGYVQLKENAR